MRIECFSPLDEPYLFVKQYYMDSSYQLPDEGIVYPEIPLQEINLRYATLRWYLLFMGLGILLVGVGLWWWLGVMEGEARQAEGVLARQLVETVGETNVGLAEVSWFWQGEGGQTAVLTLINANGTILQQASDTVTPITTISWRRWQAEAIRMMLDDGRATLETIAPDASRWLHTVVVMPEANQRLLLQRPTTEVYKVVQQVRWAALLTAVVMILSGLGFWRFLHHFLIVPIEQMQAASDVMRWRGYGDPQQQTELLQLGQRSDQIGQLARSLHFTEAEIARRFMQLSMLLETSRMVATSLDVFEVIERILDQVQTMFGVQRCAIVVLDQRANVFRIRASRGLSEHYVERSRIAPTEPNSPAMRALRKQQPVQVSDIETEFSFASTAQLDGHVDSYLHTLRPRARAEGYRSTLAIPLSTQHAPPAVLILYKPTPYRYSYSELELASSFGNHVSVAMDNAALYASTDEQLQEQTRRLEAIVESLSDGLILESPAGELLYCNRRVLDWVGVTRRAMQQRPATELMKALLATCVDPLRVQQQITAALTATNPPAVDVTMTQTNGRLLDLHIHLFKVTDAQGNQLGQGQVWRDISRDKELDRMKAALLSTASHELRTPLATIKGFATTLLADDVQWDAESQREFLQTISDETDRLTALVHNLLDMSRIEAGILQLQREPYSLNAVVQRVVKSFVVVNSRLQLTLEPNLPLVAMDVPRLETVVRNFLENAIKYSPPTTPIELSTWRRAETVGVSVRDYGAGVPLAEHDKIFERFVRLDNGLARETSGVGLGLSICKGFVEAHGGSIGVESHEVGSTFTFWLPVATMPANSEKHVGLETAVVHT